MAIHEHPWPGRPGHTIISDMADALTNLVAGDGDWRQRLDRVVDTVREMSAQTDPQAMVRAYGTRMRKILPTDRMVSLSRRGLQSPRYRITRSSLWEKEVNPWRDAHRLPTLDGGLLGEMLYGNQPRIIDEISVDGDDPAREYFDGMGSLIALPLYDGGEALNMVVMMRKAPRAFSREMFPDWLLTSNLFGRATHNLVLAGELRQAYDAVDRELKEVASMQQSMLPVGFPIMPTLDLAAHYRTSRRAGGDYYDFFPLSDGRLGMMVADVSGHGTPAAVLMAIMRTIAHERTDPQSQPAQMLGYLNERLSAEYTQRHAQFVTAFYGVYDPASRALSYSSAGHHPARVKRCVDGSLFSLDRAQALPLGIIENESYRQDSCVLKPGDQLVAYTDGITEAANPRGDQFGLANLDRVLANCALMASGLVQSVVDAVEDFTQGAPPEDDRTILVAKIS